MKLVCYRTGPKQVQSNLLPYIVEVVAADKPGILFQLADFFDRQGITIESLHCSRYRAMQTGADMFSAQVTIGIPAGHAHRRAARRLPRVLRPPEPRRDHGPDEVLMPTAKPLPRKVLDAPLALAGKDGTREATLSDHAGRWLVLYFYPKDNTPGCTTEGRDFPRCFRNSASSAPTIIGVSRDSVALAPEFLREAGLRVRAGQRSPTKRCATRST